jgi:hypothetical protein
VVKTNVKNVTLVVKLVMALLQATVILAYRDLPCPPAYVPPVSQPVPDVPPKTICEPIYYSFQGGCVSQCQTGYFAEIDVNGVAVCSSCE